MLLTKILLKQKKKDQLLQKDQRRSYGKKQNRKRLRFKMIRWKKLTTKSTEEQIKFELMVATVNKPIIRYKPKNKYDTTRTSILLKHLTFFRSMIEGN